MEDLIKLDIVFENCDSVTIERKHIYNFFITGITERITLVANALIQYKYAESCHLTLRWNEVKNLTTTLEENRTLESRINTKDITHYYLHLTNGSVIQINVPWGDREYTNSKEDHKIVGHGDKELFVITH